MEHGWEKVLNWDCSVVNRAKGGKTENSKPTWKIKDVDLEEPTSFLDHVYLGCTHRERTTSNDIVRNDRDMFEARIPARAKEKLHFRASGKLDAETLSSWSYDMKGHAKKCVERYCELASKTTHFFEKSQHRAWMTFNLMRKMNQ